MSCVEKTVTRTEIHIYLHPQKILSYLTIPQSLEIKIVDRGVAGDFSILIQDWEPEYCLGSPVLCESHARHNTLYEAGEC